MDGRLTTARAMARRCCSPPDKVIGIAFSLWSAYFIKRSAYALGGFLLGDTIDSQRQNYIFKAIAVVQQFMVLENEPNLRRKNGIAEGLSLLTF